MTDDDLLAAAILDARTAYADFEAMTTAVLLDFLFRYEFEQAFASTPEQIAFGGGRVALIRAVLEKRRDHTPSSSAVAPDPRD